MVTVLKTLLNHWKKSTAAAIALGYGTSYVKDKYEANILMKEFCEQAKKYGEEPINSIQKVRHITVLLNPAAKDGKGKLMFEKYCIPLLHLAGIRVSIVKTEHEGQAKQLMEIMENTDAVIIAGGDGTLLEAVTGMLRKGPQDPYNNVPIGVFPIGKHNSIAKALYFSGSESEVGSFGRAAMAVIKGMTKPLDVLYIEGESGKPVSALVEMQWGSFRDVEMRKSKYWYWGPLKDRISYIFSVLKGWPKAVQAELAYVLPCEGCSKCYVPPPVPSKPKQNWWQRFLKPQVVIANDKPVKDYSQVVNDECGVWHSHQIEAVDFSVKTQNMKLKQQQTTVPSSENTMCLNINVGPATLDKQDFIIEGWNRINPSNGDTQSNKMPQQSIAVRQFKLSPVLNKDEENWFTIDNENFEAMSISAILLPKRIQVFVDPAFS